MVIPKGAAMKGSPTYGAAATKGAKAAVRPAPYTKPAAASAAAGAGAKGQAGKANANAAAKGAKPGKAAAARPSPAAPAAPGGEERLPDEPRMVYVGNLPFSAEWQELKDFMGNAGTVEFARVLSLDGSMVGTKGRSRGMGYVRYATEEEAQNAIATLNGAEMDGRAITVDAWTGKKPGDGGGGGGKGGGGGYYVWMPEGGDPFGGAPFGGMGMPFGKGMFMGGFGKGAQGMGKGKGWGKNITMHGEPDQMVYVGNLPFKAEWQELKDHMKQVGTVEFVKVLTKEDGRSRGVGCVRYATSEEAAEAIASLNGSTLMDREIVVDAWSKSNGGGDA